MKRWSIFLLVLFLAACSTEEIQQGGGDENPTTRSNSDVKVKLTFPSPESPITRAYTLVEENAVANLDILVFTSAGTGNILDDKYAYTATFGTITSSGTNGDEKEVLVTFETRQEKQRFILLANLPADLRTGVIGALTDADKGVKTQRDIINALKFKGTPWKSTAFTAIPMFGQTADSVWINYDHANDPLPTTFINVNMIRALAKIEVTVDPSATDFNNTGGFTINRIYVCNAGDSGYVAPHDDYLRTPPQPSHIGRTHAAPTRTGDIVFAFPTPPARDLVRTIYLPESDSLIVQGTDTITRPAFLVIDAQYKGNQRFYRIDFIKDAAYVPLLRNHAYTINILGLKAEGYATLAEAKNSPLSTLNFHVSIEGANADINDISVYEGNDKYLLGLSTNEVIFDWENNWLGKQAADPSYYKMRVYSTYQNGAWTYSAPTGFTVSKPNNTELHITATGAKNFTGAELTPAILTVQAGFITKEITLRRTGGANSALIKFGTGSAPVTATANIPLGYVGAARSGVFNGKVLADFKDTVLWHETGTGITFKTTLNGTSLADAYLTVTATATGTNRYANALVAITWKNEGGIGMVGGTDPDQVVWSWHVWAMPETDGAFARGGDVNKDFHNPNQLLLMKRVLGKGAATHKGLVYQWGRKDPFFPQLRTGTAVIEPLIFDTLDVAVPNNLDIAIRLPYTFYKGVAPTYDWVTNGTTQVNTLWSNAPATKTYYDPCPEGWRVPPHYEDDDQSPWLNDASIVGSEYSNGYIASIGFSVSTGGYIWTSTIGQTHAYSTNISTGGVVTHNSLSHRSNGYSVRCVKDLARKY
jgi:hypothetical protein